MTSLSANVHFPAPRLRDSALIEVLPVRSPTVLFRRMDDGAVLFCSRTETYFGVNKVGADVWENLAASAEGEPRTLVDLLAALQPVYPDVSAETLSADIREFLDAMAQSELVIHVEPRAP